MKLEELKPIWKAGYLKLIIQMTITVYYLKLKLMYRLGVYRKRRCKIYKFIHRFKSQHWLAELWEQLRVLCSPGDLSRPWGHHGVWVDSREVTVPGIFRTFMVWGVLIGDGSWVSGMFMQPWWKAVCLLVLPCLSQKTLEGQALAKRPQAYPLLVSACAIAKSHKSSSSAWHN